MVWGCAEQGRPLTAVGDDAVEVLLMEGVGE